MAYTTIPKSTDYFNTTLYVGNGSSKTITGIPFPPSLVWIKARSAAENHVMVDTARGANNYLMQNTTNGNDTNPEFLKSFTSDGYTLGLGDRVNKSSTNLVSWNWKANGAGSSNTDGSINTTKTSANTTSGCSIITYTGNATAGATIGHGMGIKPSMIIIKELAGGNDWIVYTQALTANKILYLNSTAGENDNNVFFNDTEPTTSLITLGSIGATNGSGVAMIAYCFSNVKGFSKQGSYLGNGSTDGTFVYTGFKPAWIMIKKSSAAGTNWFIFDDKRVGYNPDNDYVSPNTSSAEGSTVYLDILSNGFKLKANESDVNTNGATYIYMAFASEPLVSTNGIPATAR